MKYLLICISFVGGILLLLAAYIVDLSPKTLTFSNYKYTNGTTINYNGNPQLPKEYATLDIMPSIPGIESNTHLKNVSQTSISATSQPNEIIAHPSVSNPSNNKIHALPGEELRQSITQHIASTSVSERVSYIASSTIKNNSKICKTEESSKTQSVNIPTTTISQTSRFTASTSSAYTSIAFQSVDCPTIPQNSSSLQSYNTNLLDNPIMMFTWADQGAGNTDFNADISDGINDDTINETGLTLDGYTVATPTDGVNHLCPTCNGDGFVNGHVCTTCGGSGLVADEIPINNSYILIVMGLSYALFIRFRKKMLVMNKND